MIYNTETGQKTEAPPEKWAEMVQSGKYNLDPNSTVMMDNGKGEIVPMSGSEASQHLSDPYSPVQVATDQQINRTNKEKVYGSTGQQAIGAAESFADTATLGIAKPLVKLGVEAVAGKEEAEKYARAAEGRAEENPKIAIGASLAGVAADPFDLFGLVGKAGKGAAELTTPIIENTLGKGLISKGAKAATKLATEGAILGTTFGVSQGAMDDIPYSTDAILDYAKGGALDMLKYGLPIHAAVEGFSASLGKVKSLAKWNLDRVVDAGTKSGESISEISRDELKRQNVTDPENPGTRTGVSFTKNPDGTMTSDQGKRTVTTKIPSDGNGISIKSPESIVKAGDEIGIRNLDKKWNLLKEPIDNAHYFLLKAAKDQNIESWITDNIEGLTEDDKLKSYRAKSTIDSVMKIAEPTEQQIGILRDSYDALNEIASKYPESKPPKGLIEGRVKDYMNSLDYIDSGEKIHVYNTSVLPETMPGLKSWTEKEAISSEASGVKKQYSVKESAIEKMGAESFNDVARAILDHYPNQMSKIGDIRTSYDYVAKGIKDSLNTAQEKLSSVVEKAYNLSTDAGVKTGITNNTIANYIEDKILPQYRDKLTGNPLAGQSDSFNAVKKIANEFRETGFELNKYGVREYQDINVKDLWKERQRIDTMSKWDKDTHTAATNLYKNLRWFVDDQVVGAMSKIEGKAIAHDYIDAKKQWRILNSANEIVGEAAKKALDKASRSGFSLKGGIVGSFIGGPVGAIVGSIVGDPGEFLSNNSGHIQSYFARNMTDSLSSFEEKAISATNKFFSKSETLPRAFVVKYETKTNTDILKRDANSFKDELSNREKFANNFISLNNTMFDLAPNTSNNLLHTVFIARDFLSSKLPKNPYEGIPYKENNWVPSPMEMAKYMRYREATEKPSVILDQIKKGYVTPEATEVLEKVYPATRDLIKQKMIEKISTQKSIPMEKRVMLFKTFGIPLDEYVKPKMFNDMQQRSNIGVQKTINDQNAVVNPSKISDPFINTTQGTKSQQPED